MAVIRDFIPIDGFGINARKYARFLNKKSRI